MSKRLLYLEDLYNFYSTYKKSTHFSANGKEPIVVQVAGKVKFESDSNDTEGLRKVHLQACHTDLNINQSFIEESVMNTALPSFKNRPILGYIHSVNGQDEFYSHNMHEEDGKIIYDEVPVGIIPESCNAQLVYDEDKKKTYVEVDGYIFEEYSKAASILEREGECFVSVELAIRELSYNAKEKYLNIEDMYFSGVTILGKTPSGDTVMPGMDGSNIKLADFSESNNSLFANKLDSLTEKVDMLISRFNDTDTNGKEDQDVDLDKNLEDVTETEEVTETTETTEEEVTATEENSEEIVDETPAESEESVEDVAEVEETDVKEQFSVIKGYELSHNDIRYALYNLLAEYELADNEYYWIEETYDNHFVYSNWEGNKIFGQKYTKDGDNIAFDGERWELFRELMTASEKAELESMRSNYASLVEFKATVEKNEIHAQHEEILKSDKYSVIADNEEFKKLVSEMDNYSLDELEKEAKVILADHIVATKQFSQTQTENTINKVGFSISEAPKRSSYGNIFKK